MQVNDSFNYLISSLEYTVRIAYPDFITVAKTWISKCRIDVSLTS